MDVANAGDASLLVVIALILAAAALIKYLRSGNKEGRNENPSAAVAPSLPADAALIESGFADRSSLSACSVAGARRRSKPEF
jgi:hypothetical protein